MMRYFLRHHTAEKTVIIIHEFKHDLQERNKFFHIAFLADKGR